MLTKRTNILLNETYWKKATTMAKKYSTSVGGVIRIALDEKWDREEELKQRKEVIDNILKHRKVIKGKIDYKALINEGRRF